MYFRHVAGRTVRGAARSRTRRSCGRRALLCGATAAALAAVAGASRAADLTATWFGEDGNWANPENWITDPPGFFPDNNADLTFDAVINSGTAVLDKNITIQRLVLDGGTV